MVLPEGEPGPAAELVVDRAAGEEQHAVLGTVLPADTLVSRCLETGSPQLVEDIGAAGGRDPPPAEGEPGPAMAVPLPHDVGGAREPVRVREARSAGQFTEFDLDVAASLADHAALALDRADAVVVRARTSQAARTATG